MLKNQALKNLISINSIATISPLGKTENEIWKNYLTEDHFFRRKKIDDQEYWVGEIDEELRSEVNSLREENSKYRHLDDTVLLAILAGRAAFQNQNVSDRDSGINIGSSRGATSLFEKYHEEYLKTGRSSTYSSPSTTLGNISSWVAQDLQLNGPEFSHSVTCSTGMHSILNAIAWINSGMVSNFMAGGSEAPLTGFTLAQMRAMKIYASGKSKFPCRALDMKKESNTMILSEAAGMLMLGSEIGAGSQAIIKGIGYANEKLKHGASLSKNGKCLQKSMQMALGTGNIRADAVVMHAPGTIGGDSSELNAIKKVFGNDLPAITSNKWKVGHSFATSGILSLQMAILMLKNQCFIPVPFSEYDRQPEKLDHILVNSVGFGGNAVSILIGLK